MSELTEYSGITIIGELQDWRLNVDYSPLGAAKIVLDTEFDWGAKAAIGDKAAKVVDRHHEERSNPPWGKKKKVFARIRMDIFLVEPSDA